MTPIPDQRSGAASGPQDIAARRLRRLARLLTSTGRPAEGIAAEHIVALLDSSHIFFLRWSRGPRP
jgi:hypothetical protein